MTELEQWMLFKIENLMITQSEKNEEVFAKVVQKRIYQVKVATMKLGMISFFQIF